MMCINNNTIYKGISQQPAVGSLQFALNKLLSKLKTADCRLRTFLLATLFALIIRAPYANAQTPFFQHYFLLRKNETVQINTSFQDKEGFVWFGTNKGLFKFDGTNQQRYTTADSLPDDNVTAIAEDSAGRIWTGHKNGSIAIVDKGLIKKFNPAEGSATKSISKMLFDKKGRLWFSTTGDGLYYFNEGRLYRLDEKENMPDLFVYDIMEDAQGRIWAGTDAGIAICSLNNNNTPTIKTINSKNGLSDNIIKKLLPCEDGTVWLATEDAGVINYDPASGKCKPLTEGGWKYGTISAFALNDSQVWISCPQKGLVVYDRITEQTKLYDLKVGVIFTSINSLLKDNEGNIWIGAKSGLARSLGNYIEYVETLEPVKNPNVAAIAVDKQGSIWFANSEGLFKRKVDESGGISVEKQLANSPLKNYSIISLFVDNAGYIWIGLYGDGAIRINPATGKAHYLKKELRDGNVLNITGKDNVIWLATLGGGTQITVSGEELTIKNYSSQNGLISDYIYQSFIDSKNRVWFATDGKGIDMKEGETFHHYKEGLNAKVIYGFAEDGDHHIWANVQGEGLYEFDGQKFNALANANPLHGNNINCLAADRSGNLVLMHDLGIDIYDSRKNKFRHLGEEVGIHDKIPNLNAAAKDDKGHIFFGTDKGIVIYSDMINTMQATPLPLIAGLKVVNQNVPVSQNLNFKYNQNDITINYSGFWYQNPQNLNFQYKLDNYDNSWLASRNHSVTYSNLPPGTYTFRLKVSDMEEFGDAKESSFQFVVSPPFWRTNLFYILSVLTTTLLVYVFIKFRERKLLNDKKVLEANNAELKKTNMELDKFVYSVSHDLRAPLSSMLGIIEISREETKEPMQLEHLGMLKGSIKRLDTFIQDILNYSRNSRMEVEKEEINFKDILNDITANLKYIGGNNQKAEINITIDNEAPFHSDKTRLNVVLNNLISNAIRYQNPKAEKPVIDIKVATTEAEAYIMVKDNGIGISKENQQKIFDMFYRVSKNSVGSGLGLYIVKETVDKLKGKVEVESEPGKGTIFGIHLPNN